MESIIYVSIVVRREDQVPHSFGAMHSIIAKVGT